MARMIATALREPEHRVVDFIWHGGETTVLPISFYEKAMLKRALDAMCGCPELSVCNGWRPHERYLSIRHNPNHSSDDACAIGDASFCPSSARRTRMWLVRLACPGLAMLPRRFSNTNTLRDDYESRLAYVT